MIVYVSAKGSPVEKSVRHADVEMVRTFRTAFGDEVVQISKKGGKVLTLQQRMCDVWVVNDN